jgi:nucleotide-binding universal stress UspA family protein
MRSPASEQEFFDPNGGIVMALKSDHQPTPTVYIVALDGTAAAEHVLEVACGLGNALGGAAELHLLHVLAMTPPSAAAAMGPIIAPTDLLDAGRGVLDTASAYAAAHFSGRILGHLSAGEPSREITQLASSLRADLVVVGTAGKTGIKRLALGSVAEKVVRHAGCPVLVVRPKDYHARAVPEIEPPCGDCIAVQQETARAKLWCERHSAHHTQGRLHYEVPPSFAMGSMLLRPS